MDKQKKLKIALPILVVVMAFVWGPVIFGSGPKASDTKGRSVERVVSSNTGSGARMDLTGLSTSGIRKKARTSHEDWGQNPFMLKREPKALYIEGIMWDTKNPQVILNGEMLGVGGVVESKTVIEITPNSVTLKGEDGKVETISQ